MSLAAMKQALEALEQTKPLYSHHDAKAVLRQAIAEAEKQEPVACPYCKNWATLGSVYYDQNCVECVKRMTHPQPKRTWVGLTDEERKVIHNKNYNYEELAYAVEAKLKEKNT